MITGADAGTIHSAHTVRVQKENIYKYKNQFVNQLLGQLLIQDKPQGRSART